MKIGNYASIQAIPYHEKNSCVLGRWNQWRRIVIVKVDSHYHVYSLNMIQRFVAAFLKMMHLNYFKMVLKVEIKVLGPKDLNSTAQKVAQQSPVAAPPQVIRVPAPIADRISPAEFELFERAYHNLVSVFPRQATINSYMVLAFPNQRAQVEVYLNWRRQQDAS
ncbi:MAG: hypothetical protein LLG04_08100 [Parachlamydia sp.]|nr:hypothetical protein [Parachlamydia sp.]